MFGRRLVEKGQRQEQIGGRQRHADLRSLFSCRNGWTVQRRLLPRDQHDLGRFARVQTAPAWQGISQVDRRGSGSFSFDWSLPSSWWFHAVISRLYCRSCACWRISRRWRPLYRRCNRTRSTGSSICGRARRKRKSKCTRSWPGFSARRTTNRLKGSYSWRRERRSLRKRLVKTISKCQRFFRNKPAPPT